MDPGGARPAAAPGAGGISWCAALALRLDTDPATEQLTLLEGDTVGDRRPWPAWVHSDQALTETADWLARYRRAVASYAPPPDARWRESHAAPGPGVVIAHNDAAPYNAVWNDAGLVGFVDWDMAGPRSVDDDLAWTAFSWVPLHAEHVVRAEGFTEFGRRRERLELFLRTHGPGPTPDDVLARLDRLIAAQIALMTRLAAAGDTSYRRMLDLGRADDLAAARAQLGSLWSSTS